MLYSVEINCVIALATTAGVIAGSVGGALSYV